MNGMSSRLGIGLLTTLAGAALACGALLIGPVTANASTGGSDGCKSGYQAEGNNGGGRGDDCGCKSGYQAEGNNGGGRGDDCGCKSGYQAEGNHGGDDDHCSTTTTERPTTTTEKPTTTSEDPTTTSEDPPRRPR